MDPDKMDLIRILPGILTDFNHTEGLDPDKQDLIQILPDTHKLQ